jgi:hypothetical protein
VDDDYHDAAFASSQRPCCPTQLITAGWPDWLAAGGRALPDAELDAFVEALATRLSGFDKWAIANTNRLVNTSSPPDVELGAGWDACMASIGRPAAQAGIQALMAQGFHQPGDVENRLGYYLGQIKR